MRSYVRRIILVTLWLSVTVALAPSALAQTDCLLTLEVVTENGQQASANVTISDSAGKQVVSLVYSKRPIQICDLEFGDHRIVIRSVSREFSACPVTSIEGVKLASDRLRTLRAVLNSCAIDSYWKACTVYFRIKDSLGKNLSNVDVSPVQPGLEPMFNRGKSDTYGRAWRLVPPGTTQTFGFSRDGNSVEETVYCNREGERLDRVVKLK